MPAAAGDVASMSFCMLFFTAAASQAAACLICIGTIRCRNRGCTSIDVNEGSGGVEKGVMPRSRSDDRCITLPNDMPHVYTRRLVRLNMEDPFFDEAALVEAAENRRWVEEREWTEGVLAMNRREIIWWRWYDVVQQLLSGIRRVI